MTGSDRSPSSGLEWFDRRGMTSWVEGMASALQRRVALLALDGSEVVASGSGDGAAMAIPLEVNGVTVANLEIRPEITSPAIRPRIDAAVQTFQALAEARFTTSDLVQTTARQWRELSVLYRSSELLRGGLEPETVAENLVRQATRALPRSAGAVHFVVAGREGASTAGDRDAELAPLSRWGAELEGAILATGADEIRRNGYPGPVPDGPVIVAPLSSRGGRYGGLALAAPEGRALGSEDLKLATLLAGQAGQAFANIELLEEVREGERLRRELEVAADIQASILPEQRMSWDWLEFHGVCQPAAWVGGDANLVLPTAGRAVIAGVADVSGHGVSSGLLMNAFASQLQALAMTTEDPGELLTVTNRLVSARVGAMGLFVTAVLLHLTPGGTVRLANAGHPAPVMVDGNGAVVPIGRPGLPLGVLEDESFEVTEVDLPVGASLVAFSDGVTETMTPEGELFGTERLLDTLARHARPAVDGSDLIGRVLAELKSFEGGRQRTDDLTIIVLRRTA